jgi:hypothetical protein
LIKVKIPKQKETNFPKGIFYKPEKIINLSENLKYQPEKSSKIDTKFKINIDRKITLKYLISLKTKLKKVKHIKLKFVLNIEINQKLIH